MASKPYMRTSEHIPDEDLLYNLPSGKHSCPPKEILRDKDALAASLFHPNAVMPASVPYLQRMVGNAKLQQLLTQRQSTLVLQRVLIGGIDVDTRGHMPSWEQDGVTYHLNVTTDPFHVTEEGHRKGKKNNITKTHYFFTRKNEKCKNAVGGGGVSGSKKKFSQLPQSVQDFVEKNFMALIS